MKRHFDRDRQFQAEGPDFTADFFRGDDAKLVVCERAVLWRQLFAPRHVSGPSWPTIVGIAKGLGEGRGVLFREQAFSNAAQVLAPNAARTHSHSQVTNKDRVRRLVACQGREKPERGATAWRRLAEKECRARGAGYVLRLPDRHGAHRVMEREWHQDLETKRASRARLAPGRYHLFARDAG